MIGRFFHDHPRSVGETYVEHLQAASFFAGTMIVAGIACFVHAIIPGLFVETSSKAIERLHDRMIVNRSRATSSPSKPLPPL